VGRANALCGPIDEGQNRLTADPRSPRGWTFHFSATRVERSEPGPCDFRVFVEREGLSERERGNGKPGTGIVLHRKYLRGPTSTKLFSFPESGARLFEPAGGDGSEDEASDVGQVRYAAGLHVGHCAGVQQLS
jgi:hypothetical protein